MKQRIQTFIVGFLVVAILIGGVAMAAPATTWEKIDVAYGNYKIYVDDKLFEAIDKNGAIESFNYNGWIFAPFEHIAKALGKSVKWDGDTNSLYIYESYLAAIQGDWIYYSNQNDGGAVMAAPATTWEKIDVAYADYKIYVNDKLFEATDKNGAIESFSYNGWIFAPFEHIAKALGKSVKWDGNTNSLYIYESDEPTKGAATPQTPAPTTQPLTPEPTTQAPTTESIGSIYVVITPYGAKYHKSTCRTAKNVYRTLTIKEAVQLGYEACKICKP